MNFTCSTANATNIYSPSAVACLTGFVSPICHCFRLHQPQVLPSEYAESPLKEELDREVHLLDRQELTNFLEPYLDAIRLNNSHYMFITLVIDLDVFVLLFVMIEVLKKTEFLGYLTIFCSLAIINL